MEQRPYQVEGSAFLRKAGRAILADEAGLGKTNQLLLAAEGRTLIVSPAMLQDVWEGEAELWCPDLDWTWVSYSSLCARAADKNGRLGKPTDQLRPEYRGEWDTVIFDEAHYLKGRKTLWTKAAESLRCEQAFMATGTPLVNWAHEIFKLLCLVFPDEAKPGKRLGSYWRWVGQWFDVQPGRWNPNQREVGDLHLGWTWEEFGELNGLTGHWLRRLRDDVLADLPPLVQQAIKVRLTPEQATVYKRLKKDLYARIEETGHEIISWSKGGVWTKLWKLTSGLEVEDPTVKSRGAKFQVLSDLLAERQHPTLVFCAFRESAERSAAVVRSLGKSVAVVSGAYPIAERRAAAKRFQTGEVEVLVGTLGTISEGLTLTAADTCIFMERDPRPSKNEQALRRIHRFGQTRPCLAIDLVAQGTVDERLTALLAEKTDHQMEAMTAFDAIQLV